VILVPFTQTPPTADTTLKDRLVAEYPGILRWMIEGENLRRTRGGLSALLPTTATQATNEYLDDQDTLKAWANEQCVFGPGEQMGVTRALEDYKLWCHARGEHTAIGINEFGRKFVEAFPVCNKNHTRRGNVLEGASLSLQDVTV
jgi:putative DNA primase/helicase